MDQSTLVDDQILVGRGFIERFAADGNDVQVAFWVREADEGLWFLYVATDLVDREGPLAAYRAVHDSLRKLDQPEVLSGRIKLISPDNPMVPDVLDMMEQHSGQFMYGSPEEIGSALVDAVYVYPARYFTFTQPNPMTTDEIVQEVVHLMSRGSSIAQPSRVTLKDGTSFNGSPFSLQSSGSNTLSAHFIAENEAVPRVYRVDEIASID